MDVQDLRFRIYFVVVAISGFLIFIFAIKNISWELWYFYLFWIILFTFVEMQPISLNIKGKYSLSFPLSLAVLMIYGTWFCIIVSGIAIILADTIGKRGWKKVLFNCSQFSISIFIAGAVYVKFSPPTSELFAINEHILPFVAAAVTDIVINFLLVEVIISLSSKIPLFSVIKMDWEMVALFLFSLAPIGLLMAILYTNEPWSSVLIVPLLLLAHNSFENYLRLRKQARTTIELLADVVDKRDPYTASHSSRVAAYAEQIGSEMGLPYERVEALRMAGMVHDVGKVAITNDILQKPGRLLDSEFNQMKTHPETGYNILCPLDIYKDLLLYVLYHHERMDGKGYPKGLAGQHIPLGARILAVADSFDAMTSDRPYRSAMSGEEAINELINNSGKQFDSEVVKAFLRVWEKEKQTRGEENR